MTTFKVGDRVRIIREPFFFTGYDNGIWKMHKNPKEGKPCNDQWDLNCRGGIYKPIWGTADMTHLIGVECIVKSVRKIPIGRGLIEYYLDIPAPHPVGLGGFDERYLEKIEE